MQAWFCRVFFCCSWFVVLLFLVGGVGLVWILEGFRVMWGAPQQPNPCFSVVVFFLGGGVSFF